MEPADFWKNFRLGEELSIAGSFIYNGLRRFHELRVLDHPDEQFEFLYNLSVGIERLLKIGVVLHEHTDKTDQAALERSLITHSHLALLARLRKRVSLDLGKPQKDLLALLNKFYKTLRYDRFSLISAYQGKKETEAIKAFLSGHLGVQFDGDHSLMGVRNEDRYRKFMRRTVLKITRAVYLAIEDASRVLGLYTYELRHGSKAQSIFLREIDIADEDVLWKELLIFFMNAESRTGYQRFLKEIAPLGFDPALIPDYLDCFKADASKAEVMDELEFHYEEMDAAVRKERLERLGVIGAPGVDFNDPEDDEAPPYESD